jgi:hypothetical protein
LDTPHLNATLSMVTGVPSWIIASTVFTTCSLSRRFIISFLLVGKFIEYFLGLSPPSFLWGKTKTSPDYIG